MSRTVPMAFLSGKVVERVIDFPHDAARLHKPGHNVQVVRQLDGRECVLMRLTCWAPWAVSPPDAPGEFYLAAEMGPGEPAFGRCTAWPAWADSETGYNLYPVAWNLVENAGVPAGVRRDLVV